MNGSGVIRIYTVKACWEAGGLAPLIHHLASRWQLLASRTAALFLLRIEFEARWAVVGVLLFGGTQNVYPRTAGYCTQYDIGLPTTGLDTPAVIKRKTENSRPRNVKGKVIPPPPPIIWKILPHEVAELKRIALLLKY